LKFLLWNGFSERPLKLINLAAPASVTKINYKIFGKIWSNLLVAADVYRIRQLYSLWAIICGFSELFSGTPFCNTSQNGNPQGWNYVKSAKGGESFGSTAGFNDNRGNGLDGPGQ